MKYPVFAMRDVHTGFMSPMVEQNENTAKRNFAYAINNPANGVMNYAPKDYDLFKIGEYNNENGRIEPLDIPELVCTGSGVYQEK